MYVKLNCEGAEVPIMLALVRSPLIERVAGLAVQFDCLKIPGLEGGRSEVYEAFEDAKQLHKLADFTFWPGEIDEAMHVWLTRPIRG